MKPRIAAAAATLVMLTAFDVSAEPATPSKPFACFWVHGRLDAHNGAPAFRIWPLGTKRVLGVVDTMHEADSPGVLPASVQALVSPDAFQVDVFGEFHVCPLMRDRPGFMRPVRLKDARRLIARPAHPYAAQP